MKEITILLIALMVISIGFFSGCLEIDTDKDGYNDDEDIFPDDPNEWFDLDNDGVGDNSDEFPTNSSEWKDNDGDGVGNNADDFPSDSTQTKDSDGDGYGDNPNGNNSDFFPNDPYKWSEPLPDLAVAAINIFPSNPSAKGNFYVDVYVTNIGDENSSKEFTLTVKIIHFETGNFLPLGAHTIKDILLPGEQFKVWHTYEAMVNESGVYQISAEIISDNFEEKDESNNIKIVTFAAH